MNYFESALRMNERNFKPDEDDFGISVKIVTYMNDI